MAAMQGHVAPQSAPRDGEAWPVLIGVVKCRVFGQVVTRWTNSYYQHYVNGKIA